MYIVTYVTILHLYNSYIVFKIRVVICLNSYETYHKCRISFHIFSERELKQELDQPPAQREVEECVRTLKNRKSPGEDGIPAEIFKYRWEEIFLKLHLVICAIWGIGDHSIRLERLALG